MSNHTVIAAGQFTVTLTHPLWDDGTPTTIGGFKLEGQMVQDQQLLDSSKVVALANGDTISITQSINGEDKRETYYSCTVKSCPNLIVQGNDAPDYSVVWNYGSHESE